MDVGGHGTGISPESRILKIIWYFLFGVLAIARVLALASIREGKKKSRPFWEKTTFTDVKLAIRQGVTAGERSQEC
jgi:hypothetical protein